MRWNTERWSDYKARMFEWHKRFAWDPVFCHSTRKTVWLEFVERKAVDYSGYEQEFAWMYREI